MTASDGSAVVNASHPGDGDGRVSHWRLFLLHLKVGNTVFGGGDPTMAALQSEFVRNRRWISREKYAVVYALARITPGTNLLAFCAGISWELLGWTGAFVALLGLTVPAALIVLALTGSYEVLKSNGAAMAAIATLVAAAVGMMLAAAFQLAEPYLNKRRGVYAGTIVALALILSLGFSFSPIQILALAGATGYFWQIPE
ncbi:MAG: chromate transporter [Terriglobia bacterium]